MNYNLQSGKGLLTWPNSTSMEKAECMYLCTYLHKDAVFHEVECLEFYKWLYPLSIMSGK